MYDQDHAKNQVYYIQIVLKY